MPGEIRLPRGAIRFISLFRVSDTILPFRAFFINLSNTDVDGVLRGTIQISNNRSLTGPQVASCTSTCHRFNIFLRDFFPPIAIAPNPSKNSSPILATTKSTLKKPPNELYDFIFSPLMISVVQFSSIHLFIYSHFAFCVVLQSPQTGPSHFVGQNSTTD